MRRPYWTRSPRSEPMATSSRPARQYRIGVAALVVIAVAGLYYVKWSPYYHRAFVAAEKHSIGVSIVSGKMASPPPPSLEAAVGYAWAYGKAIWMAMVLGLLLGSGVQAAVPRDWLARHFGRTSLKNVALAGAAGVPSMM